MQFNATLTQVVGKPGEMKLSLEAGLVEPAWLFEHLGKDLVVDLVSAQPVLPLDVERATPLEEAIDDATNGHAEQIEIPTASRRRRGTTTQP